MNVDGGEVERLTSLGNAGAPDWSPEGEQIAFAVGDGLESSMWVMNADGTDRRVLLATPDYESDPGLVTRRSTDRVCVQDRLYGLR